MSEVAEGGITDWTESTALDQPPSPPHGRWVKLGMVCVDTGTVAICDPCLLPDEHDPMSIFESGGHAAPFGREGLGVQALTGFGDGFYEVWGLLVDFGDFGERLAQITVTFIADEQPATTP